MRIYFMHSFCDVEALHDFSFRQNLFNIKGMQSFVHFNYSIFSRNLSITIIEKEMNYYRYRTSCLEGRFFTCHGNSPSSSWSIPFFTVERKGEKREK